MNIEDEQLQRDQICTNTAAIKLCESKQQRQQQIQVHQTIN
jgi:hypothetical protein